MKPFQAPRELLSDLNAETAARLIAMAADVALVVDGQGVIQDMSVGSEELSDRLDEQWLGQRLIDKVTLESRPKVEALLQDASAGAEPRWRQVNHPSAHGADIPMRYCAVPAGSRGDTIIIGRDLQAMAVLQQRLVDAQQAMERDYWRCRQVETRYRLLFQMATEAILIVDAATLRVVEANAAAGEMLGQPTRGVLGKAFPGGFDIEGMRAVEGLLAAVKVAGRAEEVRARAADGRREYLVSASLFRQENASLFLVRLSPLEPASGQGALPETRLKLLKILENAPDAVVLTDPHGHVLSANTAFIELAQLASEEQARGESLESWLGRPGVDLNVLMANLRQHGAVRLFPTTLRAEFGATAEVEISAAAIRNGELSAFGFIMRNVGPRMTAASPPGRALPRSVEQLTELVGKVPLKELVRESTDLIERLCIEAALQLTGDNRASAAELLGVSRQSLYVKLRRYGLMEAGPEGIE